MLLEAVGARVRRGDGRLRLGELLQGVVEAAERAGVGAGLVGSCGGELVAAETGHS